MKLPAWFVMVTLSATSACQAGTLTNDAWTPTGCGARPESPQLDLKSDAAFNRSVDVVNAHLKTLRSYVDCLTQEANADLQVVGRSANAAQQAVREARERLLAEVKAAEDKLSK